MLDQSDDLDEFIAAAEEHLLEIATANIDYSLGDTSNEESTVDTRELRAACCEWIRANLPEKAEEWDL